MFTDFSNCKLKEIISGFMARFIHANSQTLSLVKVTKGAILPEHSHPHEQVSQILNGEFEMTINGVTKICHQGDIAIINLILLIQK